MLRCTDCGTAHWASISGRSEGAARTCSVCGGELTDERRRPGRGRSYSGRERRDVPIAVRDAGGDRPRPGASL
jgi:hypothetical protein